MVAAVILCTGASARAEPSGSGHAASPGSAARVESLGSGAREPADSAPAAAATRADDALTALGSTDLHEVARGVAAIESVASSADVRFAAARACEDKLADPARALALYQRILDEQPDARAAVAARKRADDLSARLGASGEFAREAAELAQLRALADRLDSAEIERRGDALAARAWPGAGETALWLARWEQRRGNLPAARARFARIVAAEERAALAKSSTSSPLHDDALRGGASAALDAHDFSDARRIALRLPAADPGRANLLFHAARGTQALAWNRDAWTLAALALLALLASLLDAAARGGWRAPRLRPPLEIVIIGPLAIGLAAYAYADGAQVAPVIAAITAAGIALAWLGGAALELARDRGRPTRLRGALHAVACLAGVAGVAFIAVWRCGLLEP